jgi:hypothetical protein
MLTYPTPLRPEGKYRMSFAEFCQLCEMNVLSRDQPQVADGVSGIDCKVVLDDPKNAFSDGRPLRTPRYAGFNPVYAGSGGPPQQVDCKLWCPTLGTGFMPALIRQSPSRNALQNAGILQTALMFGRPAPSQMPMQEARAG